MANLKIEYRKTSELRLRKTNPRTHSEAQIEQLKKSIEYFGFTNPLLIEADGTLIAGHGRVEAARRIGMDRIPVIAFADMSPEDIRAYVIADNKLAENAGWDTALLALELKHLSELEIDFDVTLTGFELPEIDIAVQSLTEQGGEHDPSDNVPELQRDFVVTRPGDIWHIGPHRLICGDSTQAASFQELLVGSKAQMVFSDPPYNVPISGHVSGLGANQHPEFAMASGEMSSEEFAAFLLRVFENLATFSVDGSIHFQCMDWRHMNEILTAGQKAYHELKNLCIWSKSNGGMGSLYRSQHELVFVFKSGSGRHINNVALGKHGRNRTNVWNYAGANSFGDGQADLALHPTVKPVALIRDAILDCSNRGEIVLDAFCGSGSTLVAAHETDRKGYGIEIDPRYCDTTIERLSEICGLTATLGRDGPTYEDLVEERSAEALAVVEHVAS